MINGLIAALQQLAGPGVAVAVRDSAELSEPAWPVETVTMTRASPARLAEFSAGRAAARAALHTLGQPQAAIPSGPDRAPVWPLGIVGSISHTRGICAALVGQAGPIRAIGVDLEPDEPLDPDLWADICGPVELDFLTGLPPADRGRAARLIFSAKECTYKCIYPQMRTVVGFDAMTLTVDLTGSGFAATPRFQLGPIGPDDRLCGGYAVVAGLIATVMVLR